MVRDFITNVLNRFDASMIVSRQVMANLRVNLEIFNHIAYEDIRKIVDEIKSSDPRISADERNRGFYINFEGKVLFRVGLNAFSERSELVVDGHPILKYSGGEDPNLYSTKYKKYFHDAVLSAFAMNLDEVFNKELEKL